jgi:hypothetical protein
MRELLAIGFDPIGLGWTTGALGALSCDLAMCSDVAGKVAVTDDDVLGGTSDDVFDPIGTGLVGGFIDVRDSLLRAEGGPARSSE